MLAGSPVLEQSLSRESSPVIKLWPIHGRPSTRPLMCALKPAPTYYSEAGYVSSWAFFPWYGGAISTYPHTS